MSDNVIEIEIEIEFIYAYYDKLKNALRDGLGYLVSMRELLESEYTSLTEFQNVIAAHEHSKENISPNEDSFSLQQTKDVIEYVIERLRVENCATSRKEILNLTISGIQEDETRHEMYTLNFEW